MRFRGKKHQTKEHAVSQKISEHRPATKFLQSTGVSRQKQFYPGTHRVGHSPAVILCADFIGNKNLRSQRPQRQNHPFAFRKAAQNIGKGPHITTGLSLFNAGDFTSFIHYRHVTGRRITASGGEQPRQIPQQRGFSRSGRREDQGILKISAIQKTGQKRETDVPELPGKTVIQRADFLLRFHPAVL